MPGTKRERSPGKWTLTVTLGTDYKGKKRRFNKTFHGSSAEADKELALFYADCIRGSVRQASNMTVDQMVESYINDRPKGSLKKLNRTKAVFNSIAPLSTASHIR